MDIQPNSEARSESGWKRRADKLLTRQATRFRSSLPSGLLSPSVSANSIGFVPLWESAIRINLRKKSERFSQRAGALLLLAAANATDLLSQLEVALPMNQQHVTVQEPAPPQLFQPQLRLLLTLLFLNAVGLHRPWDLRTYTGSELALLTGRPQPYSYRHYVGWS